MAPPSFFQQLDPEPVACSYNGLLDIDLETPFSELDISIRRANEPTTAALYLSYDDCQQLFDGHDRLLDHDTIMPIIHSFIERQYIAPPDLRLWTDPDVTVINQPLMQSFLLLALTTARRHMHAGVEILLSTRFSRRQPSAPTPPVDDSTIHQVSPPMTTEDHLLGFILASLHALDSHLDIVPDLHQGRADHVFSGTPLLDWHQGRVLPLGESPIDDTELDPGPRASVPVVNRLPDDDPSGVSCVSTRRSKQQYAIDPARLSIRQCWALQKFSGMSIRNDTQPIVDALAPPTLSVLSSNL